MAEMDNGEYEVKDEELVDFEELDYGFESDEELEIDKEVVQPHLEGNAVLTSQEGKQSDTGQHVNGGGPLHSGKQEVTENERRGEAESGEIEEEKDEKDDGVVMQPLPSFVVANNNHSCERRVRETRRKHCKGDLEDGKLDDTAMVIPILFLFVLYLAPHAVPTTTAIFCPSFSFVNSPLLASWTWFLLLRAARLFLSFLDITCG